MFDPFSDRRRNVVPRWRALEFTSAQEIRSINRFPSLIPIKSSDFKDLVETWRREESVEAASDLLDVGIISGDKLLSREAAATILSRIEEVPTALARAARAALADMQRPLFSSQSHSIDENKEALRATIANYKRRVVEAPRDALSHVELSRCYSRLAAFERAAHHMFIALQLAPDDRFILRAAARFYTMRDDPSAALRFLRQSSSISQDPWLQSAEIAVSELFDKGSKFAKKAVREIRGVHEIQKSRSELALAVATLEQKNGLRVREVFKIIDSALVDPTENALAQSVWLTDQAGREFGSRFPNVTFPEDAHEAKSIEFEERGLFIESEREGRLWLSDQPFQVRAALQVGNLNLVHLRDYQTAAAVSESALELHPDDWHLLNLSVIANAMNGNIVEAERRLLLFERKAVTDEMKAFTSAARGMMQFLAGSPDIARASYQEAVALCRRAKKPELIANAVIYWFEREAVIRNVGPGEVEKFEASLQSVLAKLPSHDRKEIGRAWASRKPVVEEAVREAEQLDFEWMSETLSKLTSTLHLALTDV